MNPITPTDLALVAVIALLVGVIGGMALMHWTERAVMRS